MKVLIIPSWYPDAGNPTAGIFVAQQARALVRQGVEVAVLFPSEHFEGERPSASLEDGILTVRTGRRPLRSSGMTARRLGTAWRLVSVRLPAYRRRVIDALQLLTARGFTPDVIHVHALWPAGAAAVVAGEKMGVPIVVTEHSEEYSRNTERLLVRTPGVLPLVLRPLARRAAAYVAVSSELAARLRELRIAGAVEVIPNVVPERCTVMPVQDRPPYRILHVSQLGPAKNIPLLLRATAELRRRRDDFVLDIVGESEFRKDAERLADELGLTGGTVRFLGRLAPAGVQNALDESAFAVLSSLHENSSVFAAEALMAGRPLLTTDCGGHVEYLDDSLGRVVANNDAGALVEGLDYMLDHFREFEPSCLNAFARAHFSEQAVCSQLLRVYREVLGG